MTEASLIIRITVKCGEVMTQQAQAFHQKYRQPQIIFPDYDSGLNMNTSSKYSPVEFMTHKYKLTEFFWLYL